MDKTLKIIIMITSALFLSITYFAVVDVFLNVELSQKNLEITGLQKQLGNQPNFHLVTSLGISTDPRNVTYPHPHFTIEGAVYNFGNETAYNARLDIVAYYKNYNNLKNYPLALNMSIPLGNIEKSQVVQVNQIIVTDDWIGNYTVKPRYNDSP